MARTLIMGLILLLGLPLPIFAGQITDVRVEKKAQDEIEIVIEGAYGAYQGIGLRSPARFVIVSAVVPTIATPAIVSTSNLPFTKSATCKVSLMLAP